MLFDAYLVGDVRFLLEEEEKNVLEGMCDAGWRERGEREVGICIIVGAKIIFATVAT